MLRVMEAFFELNFSVIRGETMRVIKHSYSNVLSTDYVNLRGKSSSNKSDTLPIFRYCR